MKRLFTLLLCIGILVSVTGAFADALEDLFLSISENTTIHDFEENAERLGLKYDSYTYFATTYYRVAADMDTASIRRFDEGLGANADGSYVEAHFSWGRDSKLLDYLLFDEENMIAGFVSCRKNENKPSRFHGLGCFIIDYNRNETGQIYEGGYKPRTVSYVPIDSPQAIIDYVPIVIRDSYDPLQRVFMLICQDAAWEDIEITAQEWGLSCMGSAKKGYLIAYTDNVALPNIREPGSFISVDVSNGHVCRAFYYDIVVQYRENAFAEYVTDDYWGKNKHYNYPDEPGIYLMMNSERTKFVSAEDLIDMMNSMR